MIPQLVDPTDVLPDEANREMLTVTQQSLLRTLWLAQAVEGVLMRQHDRVWTPTPPTGDAVGEEQVRRLIRPLLRRVNVERIQQSCLLDISLEGADPSLIANMESGSYRRGKYILPGSRRTYG